MNYRFKAIAAIMMTLASLGSVSTALAADLTVKITNIKVTKGEMFVALFSSSEKDLFPKKAQQVKLSQTLDIPQQTIPEGKTISMKVTFRNIPEGTYAVGAVHDLNKNKILDLNKIKVPTEPFGFSKLKPRLRVPTFKEAEFKFPETSEVTVQLR